MSLEYFNLNEFSCPCCGLSKVRRSFLRKLDRAREFSNIPYIINSGCRCRKHNKKVGGVDNSAHVADDDKMCCAVDIKAVNSHTRYRVIMGLMKAGIHRIGIGNSFIHADDDKDKSEEVIWHYYNKG